MKKFRNICKSLSILSIMNALNEISSWLHENWIIVALVISEVAALLPVKAKGIIHFFVKVGNAIFKQSSKSQNFNSK